MGCLILVSGVPGSGKSTFCAKYEERGKIAVFSSDETRKQLTGSYINFSKEKEMWQTLYNNAYTILTRFPEMDVILDATYLSENQRLKVWRNFCEVADDFCLVQFQLDPNLARKQNESREKVVPGDAFDAMLAKFQPVTAEELNYYGSVVIVRNRDTREVLKYGNCSRHIDWL